MTVLTDSYSTQHSQCWDISTVLGNFQPGNFDETSSSSLVLYKPTNNFPNHRILQLLAEFGLLKENWDMDGAVQPALKAIENARYITQLLGKHGQPVYHAAPGPNGEIMIDIRNKRKSRSLELVFYDDRSVAVKFPEESQPQQLLFSTEMLSDLLNWLNAN
jgi:hypothetical protein